MFGRFPPSYEGALASLAPYASLIGARAAGSVDVALGRFGWLDIDSGDVSNTASDGFPFGITMQRRGSLPNEGSAVYWRGLTRYLRSGKPITLAATGVFWVRFPQGASIGATVYADPATGIAYAADGGGFVPTKFKTVTDAGVGCLGIISPYSQFG